MATILLTGATGTIGSKLLPRLCANHRVICLSRKTARKEGDAMWVQGDFLSFEDLRKLDIQPFDMVIHLAAVTGGCSEEDALEVNVAGVRRLLRYALDRKCRRFIMASSVAAAGCLMSDYLPARLPVPADSPCLGSEPYGLSKWLMEELTRYFQQGCREADFLNLRFGGVWDDDTKAPGIKTCVGNQWPLLSMGMVYLSDILTGLEKAAALPHRPGVRNAYLVAPDNPFAESVADVLRARFGAEADAIDLGAYASEATMHGPVFDAHSADDILGWHPVKSVRA